jgi:hypothetical protein
MSCPYPTWPTSAVASLLTAPPTLPRAGEQPHGTERQPKLEWLLCRNLFLDLLVNP